MINYDNLQYLSNSTTVPSLLTENTLDSTLLKHSIEQFQSWLADAFHHDADVALLLQARSHFIDQLLTQLWRYTELADH